ncbi:uncharacterized protein TNCV_853071 [Trichonephila clavipes]|nr:uncharacterized protein TNCV_853071 [Trichonephila clavipes]
MEYVTPTKATREAESFLFGRSRDYYSAIGPSNWLSPFGYWLSGRASRFHTTGSRLKPRTGKNVAWSDESHFQLNRVDGCVRIWRQPHEFMDPTCQHGTVQAGGSSVMEHSSEFRHFHWPPKSPYMNIIEHILDALQRAIQKGSPPPLTPTDLWTTLPDSWCQLPTTLLQTLIKSMTRRVATLLRARWGPTRY